MNVRWYTRKKLLIWVFIFQKICWNISLNIDLLFLKSALLTERKYLFVQNKEVQGLYFDNESPGPKFRSITSSFSSACVGGAAVLTSRDWLSYYSHRVRESISTFSTRLLADRYINTIVHISVSRWRGSQSGPNSRGWILIESYLSLKNWSGQMLSR